jgi:Ca-activated chloride channel homolog
MNRFMKNGIPLAVILCVLAALIVTGCESGNYNAGSNPTSSAPSVTPPGSFMSTPGFVSDLPGEPSGLAEERIYFAQDPSILATLTEDDSPGSPDTPGSGAMLGLMPTPGSDEIKQVPLPLKHTDVKASITGYIASVGVTQQFQNPYDTKIEAVYVFPLPQDAAINEFVMTIGDRRIRGIIRERQEAERLYKQARAQGYHASLMTQERANIFTQKVANIEPGKQIDVSIRYFHTLPYSDGTLRFVFPMVVGPRFNPPNQTDGIAAVPHGSIGTSKQSTEVSYLRPNERSGHDIALSVDIDAGMPIDAIASSSHQILATPTDDPNRRHISIAPGDRIPNKDFVLRIKVAGDKVRSGLLTHRDKRGGYFSLMLVPPAELGSLPMHPMEMVFVLDCSGSMSGEPLDQAKDAIRYALDQLRPRDSFQIIRFSNDASALGDSPLSATPKNIRRGKKYLKSLRGQGGTVMIEGVRAALDFPHDQEKLRVVCFMTDGYIGNEVDILREVRERTGASRIFSFGVGSSPNRFLLERMAGMGRGTAAYVGPGDDGAQIMDAFLARASRPAMTGLRIDWRGADVFGLGASQARDLFVGRPLVITGRYRGDMPDTLAVTGSAGGEPIVLDVKVKPQDPRDDHAALASVWARNQIADLADRQAYERDADPELAGQIEQLALDYNLVSAYTAFVAVDASQRTAGSEGVTVHIPVPVPAGVKYETTVGE